jgi:hypothetical protein
MFRVLILAGIVPGVLFAGDVPASAPFISGANESMNASAVITQNQGQWADSILFRAGGGDVVIWGTQSRLYLQHSQRPDPEILVRRVDPSAHDRRVTRRSVSLTPIELSGAANALDPIVGALTETRHHYFLGGDRSRWRRDVPTYSSLTLRNVYPQIDIEIGEREHRLALRWIVGIGGDPNQIALRMITTATTESGGINNARFGADQLSALLMCTEVYRRDHAGHLRYVGSLAPSNDSELAFTATANSLPPVIGYSTYLGGTSYDAVYGIDTDPAGRIIIIGNSESANFPTTDSYDGSYNGGAFGDVVIARLTAAGGALEFSTFIGGGAADIAAGLVVDTAGHIYATGVTASGTSFPLVAAFDSLYGGYGDAFVFKLSPDGDALLYSSFVGGGGEDYGRAVAVDAFGAAYLTGRTGSLDFPIIAASDAGRDGLTDAFVVKVSPAGDALEYSSYLGGSGDEEGYGIAVDSSGRAVVRGTTSSLDFPTPGGFQTAYRGGERDVFVARLSTGGDSLEYGTYLGGSSSEYGIGLQLDHDGAVWLSGATRSVDFPLVDAYDSSLGGLQDLFVARLAPDGDALEYSTYLGGSEEDFNGLLALDECGTIYLTGYTYSTDYPTVRAFDPSHNGGADLILTLLSPAGDSLLYSSYLGGSEFDFPGGIAVPWSGTVWVAGLTDSPDFPTHAPYADTLTGDYDIFATVISGFDIAGCSCTCPCHADPQCDGVTNVLDVVAAVNVAFRGASAVTDPNCPFQQTDATCDGVTNVIDVVRFVNVAFRGGDVAAEFCDPCAL